jgi:hypothetical protein
MLAIAAVTAKVRGSSSNAFANAVTDPDGVAKIPVGLTNDNDGVVPTATSATHWLANTAVVITKP